MKRVFSDVKYLFDVVAAFFSSVSSGEFLSGTHCEIRMDALTYFKVHIIVMISEFFFFDSRSAHLISFGSCFHTPGT